VEARKGEVAYTGLRHAAQTIYREEGFKAFFKGGPARIMRSSPQFGFTLAGYELLQRGMFPFEYPFFQPTVLTRRKHYLCQVRLSQNRVLSHLLASQRQKHRCRTSAVETPSKSFSIWTRTLGDRNCRPTISGQAFLDSAQSRRRDLVLHVSSRCVMRLRVKWDWSILCGKYLFSAQTLLYQPVLCFFGVRFLNSTFNSLSSGAAWWGLAGLFFLGIVKSFIAFVEQHDCSIWGSIDGRRE
jgi:hypothetical protein